MKWQSGIGKNLIEIKMNKLIQLFMLPFAGGNSFSFNSLAECIDDEIEVLPIEYAGRGKRIKEGYITEYSQFLDDVVCEIKRMRNTNQPYALFGYSMGAALAYEIASKDLLDTPPIHLFYGARSCIATESIPSMDEDDFVEYSKTLGGFDERVFQNKRWFKLFIHPLKDDYHIAKQYKFSEGIIPGCDATIFYSENDTPFKAVHGWKKLTNGSTEFYEFGDNHFFMNEHYQEMARIINKTLLEKGE